MSCTKTSNMVAETAGRQAGLRALPNKVSCVTGQLASRLSRSVGRSATAALSLVNSVDPPRSVESLLPLAAVGALLGGNSVRLRLLNTVGAILVARAVATGLGTGLARLSRSQAVQTQNFFNGKVQLRSWPSRLTPLLNAGDIQGWPVRVQYSLGQMVEHQGQTWHLGMTTVKSSAGERTITHLQSLSWPGRHYYFNRALPETEVTGIITGQRDFEARHLPGYAGEIGEAEALAPVVAQLKKRLIQLHLFWGGQAP